MSCPPVSVDPSLYLSYRAWLTRGFRTDICMIGAGVGGVSTAARLAKAGFKVTVVEKNDFTGGRCSLINHDGFVSSHTLFRIVQGND